MAEIDGKRLGEALSWASELHAGQTRKDGDVPYVSHLLGVCAGVIEQGGDTDQAIAALLHDALEDTELDLAQLEERCGPRVARIVRDCTDTLPGDTPEDKAPWRVRKERYLEHLGQVSHESLLVAACDKRHNLRGMVNALRARGLQFLLEFRGSPPEQVWYFQEVNRRIVGKVPLALQLELEELTDQLRMLIQAGDTQGFDLKKMGFAKEGAQPPE